MAKLYPPYLSGIVPSFYSHDSKIVLNVPFSLNKTVGLGDIAGFALKIKTVQTNTLVGSYTQLFGKNEDLIKDAVLKQTVPFEISPRLLTVGQFYKVQLAFIDKTETIGYYSSTAVTKYTTKPLIYLSGLDYTLTNNHNYTYTGIYSQGNGDPTEKMYSCRFVMKDSNGKIFADSGDIIHHTYNDTSARESHEEYSIPNDLEQNKSYYMTFSVKTNNGMVVESHRYRIIKAGEVSPDMDVTLYTKMNYEDGYIDLILKNNAKDFSQREKKVSGMFYILRAASNDAYAWREMGKFTLQAQVPSRNLWKDYSVEQGVTYVYAIQQYNNYGLRSDKIKTQPVVADFEDAFLYDGTRQLKIKYNPKVSSFTREIKEQETETIGSKYPFIFRNGNVDYHRFPISGLISYLGDENQQFMKKKELGIENSTTDLISENILAERLFKTEVLKWLSNGEPKLFRSPGEGNFVVRLLKVSLSPNDTVGRMLHSFSCQATEISNNSYESLKGMGFIDVGSDVAQTRYQSINISGHSQEMDMIARSIMSYYELKINIQLTEELYYRIMNSTYIDPEDNVEKRIDISKSTTKLYTLVLHSSTVIGNTVPLPKKLIEAIASLEGKVTFASGKLNARDAYSIDIQNARPGTMFRLDKETIIIGPSGNYYIEMPKGVKDIYLPQKQPRLMNPVTGKEDFPMGVITYSYLSDMANVFDLYSGSDVVDYPVRVWYGTPTRKKYNPYKGEYETTHDIIECIKDVKTSIIKIFKVKFSKRFVQPVFAKTITEIIKRYDETLGSEVEEKKERLAYFFDMDCKKEMTDNMRNPAYLYQVCKPREDYKYEEFYKYTQWFTDANFRMGYYMSGGKEYPYTTKEMIDGLTGEHFMYEDNFYDYSLGKHTATLQEMDYELEDQDLKIDSIVIGKGVVCEMSYQTRVMTFSCEREEFQVPKAKRDLWDNSLLGWKRVKESFAAASPGDETRWNELLESYNFYRQTIDSTYEDLVTHVATAKKDFEEAMK